MYKSNFFLSAVILLIILSECINGQTDNSVEEQHHEGLHFSHPLFTESISPDTKLRVDYQYIKINSITNAAEIHLEYEYAFNSTFSISITAPYVFLAQPDQNKLSNLGNVEVSFRFANFDFVESNLLLGYGMAVGLPTGDQQKGIGSNHVTDLEPFFNLGYMINNFEFTFFSTFGIPANLHQGESAENDLNLQLAAIYNFTYRIQGVLEFNRQSVLNGNTANNAAWYAAPGIKVVPFKYMPKVIFGLGVRLPVSNIGEFDSQLLFSMFYHF